MASETMLLRVVASRPLPGLGLLALPDGPTPYLAACGLHTALAIEAHLPDGTCHQAWPPRKSNARRTIPITKWIAKIGRPV